MKPACKAIATLLLAISGAVVFTTHAIAQEPVFVPVGSGGMELFLVEQPQAMVSPALLCNETRVSKEGRVPPPTPGFTLHATVLCDTAADQSIAELAVSFGGHLRPRAQWQGPAAWQAYDFSSVASALDTATLLADVFGQEVVFLDVEKPTQLRSMPNDPLVPSQWHLLNGVAGLHDMNVEPVWTSGITGAGITVGLADNGAEQGHPDLAANFNSSASTSPGNSSHGTSCAGLIAAVANNGIGVAGVAYGAQWSEQAFGSASTNAFTFGYSNQVNVVKSNSWGPLDIGVFDTMTPMEKDALQDAVEFGRNGLGVVFTWACGNGRQYSDRVEYDPYASDRRTIAVGGVDYWDLVSSYSEAGSSLLLVTPNDNASVGLTTTTSVSLGGYTSYFGGTSASSSLVAGVVALILEANPSLNWREVQHALLCTARKCDSTSPGWVTNGAGFPIHYDYGFGAVDASAAVTFAQTMNPLGPEYVIDSGAQNVGVTIPDNNTTGVTRTISINDQFVVEHVELVMNITHTYIGDLDIRITSPSGTVSELTKKRTDSNNNLVNYSLSSVRHWGESSAGTWTIQVKDLAGWDVGTWNSLQLLLYGNRGGNPTQLNLTVSALIHGAVSSAQVSYGAPSAPTWLAYSLSGLGSTSIPALGVVLGLSNPQPYGSMELADGLGNAEWDINVPVAAAGFNYWLQALQFGLVSNIAAGTIQ
jgi:subtilisin-like proprotein convertase family protein